MHRHPERGHTLVELMVGMTVGLIVTTIALLGMAQHLRVNQRLVQEARLMQDLQTVTDLIARSLRRAGPLEQQDDMTRLQATDQAEEQAYRLRNGVIEMKIGEGHWQAMTDAGTLRVTALRIVPHTRETVLHGHCSKPCTEGDGMCPPRQVLRSAELMIAAASVDQQQPNAIRTVQTTVQQRHDVFIGACPA